MYQEPKHSTKQHAGPLPVSHKQTPTPGTPRHILLTLFTVLGLLVALESVVGDVVQAEDSLVGVLHDQILAILKSDR